MDAPLDSSSSRSDSSTTSPPSKKSKLLQDEEFFAPIEDLEELFVAKHQNLVSFISNLRAESEYWVLPHGYIVLLDGDNLNQLKKPDASNYVYVKMLRKVISDKKQILPVCLLCNEEGKANAIIDGTSFSLPDDTIPNELSKCKHEEVSKLLYTHDRVMDVESEPKNCTVIKDSDKVHIAASFCGKSYAAIVLNLSKQSRTGKCCSCKGSKCEHQKNWNKELRLSVLKEKNVDKKASEASSSGEKVIPLMMHQLMTPKMLQEGCH